MRIPTSTPDPPKVEILIQNQDKDATTTSKQARRQIVIDRNWTFWNSSQPPSTSLPVAQFPTNIHLDLRYNKLIADPFHGKHERDLQWIGLQSWTYQTEFSSPRNMLEHTVLCFDGLDTYASVNFNDQCILVNKSMFIPTKVDVSRLLRPSGIKNTLTLVFESAWLKGLEIVKDHPDHHWGCSNGHPSRLAVRKAQYHYGWDWGPKFMTCGPWRPIYLESFSNRISDLQIRYKLTENFDTAVVQVLMMYQHGPFIDPGETREGHSGVALITHIVIYNPDGSTAGGATCKCVSQSTSARILIQSPQLWYPARYGEQPMYQVVVTLESQQGDVHFDRVQHSFGLRKVELVQENIKGQMGKSFYFRINNVPIFCGGSCWIPAHSFLPSLTRDDYRAWVRLAVEGNQSMIRVWAGGVYEDDAFYEACDELGLLVWQDFMMACGAYPTHPEFLRLIKEEACANVKRLIQHPSIILWAGNNEDYQYQEDNGLEYDPDDRDPNSWLHSNFPARYIYEKLLPEILHQFDENAIYRFGSPFGGKTSNDANCGDIHQWNVWHGQQRPYQEWSSLTGRFVSEFGMQALPDISTIEAFMTGIDENEWHPYSSSMDFHNKAFGQARRMAMYMAENLRFELQPLQRYSYLTQLMQSECLGHAFRAFKRSWGSSEHRPCGGALVWQLNDCWPCTSWSIVDHFRNPKMAYWAIRRELATLTVGMERFLSDDEVRGQSFKTHHLRIWGTNLGPTESTVDLVIHEWNIESGAHLGSQIVREVVLAANSTEDLGSYRPCYAECERGENDYHLHVVVAAYLYQHPGRSKSKSTATPSRPSLLARYISWPEPLRYTSAHDTTPKLQLDVRRDEEVVRLGTDLPVKGALLSIKGLPSQTVRWSDNGIDLVPQEIVEVHARGIRTVAKGGVDLEWYGRKVDAEADRTFVIRDT